jgi:hypothetical protein
MLPKKRGRPPGVRNKPRAAVPPSTTPLADYHYPDPNAMVARQLSLLDWAQQAMRNEIERGMQGRGISIQDVDVARLEKLSNALVRAIQALRQVSDLADELSKRLTPEQLLEAALKKVEGQDAATLRYAIKRLRAYLEKIAPVSQAHRMQLGEPLTASAAIAALDDEADAVR